MLGWYRRTILPHRLNAEMGAEGLEEVRSYILKRASRVTLEIGFGPGYNFRHYKTVSKLYALEPSRELIAIAKTRLDQASYPVEFLNAYAEKIPLPDGSVDTVVSTWSLCSVTNPTKVLQEVKRVLKHDGAFIFIEHGASPSLLVRIAQGIFTFFTKYFTGNCHCDRKIDDLIYSAGLDVREMDLSKEPYRPLIYNYEGIAMRT